MSANQFSKREILKYVGDLSQVFGIKDYTMNGGKAQGVRAFEINNGSGLEFTILPDRAMDLAWLSYKGKNLSYISKTGIVSPQYYNETGLNFLRSFYAGFLTTCGLRNVGTPCTEDGEEFGVHGRISNTPAEEAGSCVEWINNEPVLKVRGNMKEARLFGENIVLHREITCKCGENKIYINDAIENNGFRKEPLMLLYHFNLGFPLLDEDAEFITSTKELKPRDEEAKKGTAGYNVFQKPTPGYSEQVFYHELKSDKDGNTCVALMNERLELGVAMRFNKNQLWNLSQWKQMGEGEYVLGIEPGNCFVEGRVEQKKKGRLEYLEPGEIRKYTVEIEILDGRNDLDRVRNQIAQLQD